jgi:hypothetical protein
MSEKQAKAKRPEERPKGAPRLSEPNTLDAGERCYQPERQSDRNERKNRATLLAQELGSFTRWHDDLYDSRHGILAGCCFPLRETRKSVAYDTA